MKNHFQAKGVKFQIPVINSVQSGRDLTSSTPLLHRPHDFIFYFQQRRAFGVEFHYCCAYLHDTFYFLIKKVKMGKLYYNYTTQTSILFELLMFPFPFLIYPTKKSEINK